MEELICIFVEQRHFRQWFSFETLYLTDVKFTVDPGKNISRRITERLMTDWFILQRVSAFHT